MALFREALDNTVVRPIRCRLCTLLNTLDPQDRVDLIDALDDPDMGATRISRALNAIGHPVPEYTVARHRSRRHDHGSSDSTGRTGKS